MILRSSNCRFSGGDVDDGHPVVYFRGFFIRNSWGLGGSAAT